MAPSPFGGRLGWGRCEESDALTPAPTCSAHIGVQAVAARWLHGSNPDTALLRLLRAVVSSGMSCGDTVKQPYAHAG